MLPRTGKRILDGESLTFRVKHGPKIFGALCISSTRKCSRARGIVLRVFEQVDAFTICLHGSDRILGVGQRVQQCLAIQFHGFLLFGRCSIDLTLETTIVEDRRHHPGGQRKARVQDSAAHRAIDERAGRKLDVGQKGCACAIDITVCSLDAGCCRQHVGPPGDK